MIAQNQSCHSYEDIEKDLALLQTIDCLKGFVPFGKIQTFPWAFTSHSKSLFTLGKRCLDLGESPFIVFHWRRGDQLTDGRRCGAKDKSLNCGGVDEFIDDVDKRVASYKLAEGQVDVRVYIATDEVHHETLQALATRSFNHSTYLVAQARKHNVTLDSADSFVIDLMLMCTANVFVYYGYSYVNKVADSCRAQKVLT
jgi:hypothetical protein